MSIAHLVSIMTGIYNFIHSLTGKPQRHRLCGSPARLMTQTVSESLTQGEALLFKDGFAGEYVKNLGVFTKSSGENKSYSIAMMCGDGIGYIMPQKVEMPSTADKIEFMFRVRRPFKDAVIQVIRDGVVLREVSKKNMLPAEMQKLMLTRAEYGEAQETILFTVVDKEEKDKEEQNKEEKDKEEQNKEEQNKIEKGGLE